MMIQAPKPLSDESMNVLEKLRKVRYLYDANILFFPITFILYYGVYYVPEHAIKDSFIQAIRHLATAGIGGLMLSVTVTAVFPYLVGIFHAIAGTHTQVSYGEYRDLLIAICMAERNSAVSIANYLDLNKCFKEIDALVKMGAKVEDFKYAFYCRSTPSFQSFEKGLVMNQLVSSLQDSLNAKLLEDALFPYCQEEDNDCKKAFLKGYKRVDEVRCCAAQEEEEYFMQLCRR